MNRAIVCGLLAALLLCAPWAMGSARAEGLSFSLTPANVEISTFYNGTTIAVAGQAPAGCDVVLRLSGAPAELHMKQKGKVFGLLWMNTDKVTFSNVPQVALVAATKAPMELGQAGAEMGLGGLRKAIGVESGGDKDQLVAELVKLKTKEGLYRQVVGGISLDAPQGDTQAFHCDLAIPSRLAPGQYTLDVVAIKDGQTVAQGSAKVQAQLGGVPAYMADLAFNHAALYGILASVIAIVSGLIIGLIFQGGGSH